MATIFIDDKPYDMQEGNNVLEVCLSAGANLPYFCWHPALGSVGACRQCAVKQFKDEKDTKGRLVMACMVPAVDNIRISIEDAEAVQFRAGIAELLMVNHPHDCAVCDEGGECHLQDMIVMTGHHKREYRFNKRTHQNQDLGPFVNHEMNRCITCYRCVRFYKDYAGGRDFDVFGAHDNVYFGRQTDGVLENEFSGNLVEVCPTGVFDDKSLMHHFTRKWDLQTAPSVCVNCAVGCNTIPGERLGVLRRIRNRYNPDVNGYFLCDRGRYGYEFVNSDRRLRQPLVEGKPVTKAEALRRASALLADKTKVIGIGSPRASLESNFALRELVGAERFYSGDAPIVTAGVKILQQSAARIASLRDVGMADAVLILGEDVTNVAPMLALALRQAVRQEPLKDCLERDIPLWDDTAVRSALQDQKGPFYVATPSPTKLDEIATKTCRGAPDDLARLGMAVAHALDANAPAVSHPLAGEIAAALRAAEHPLIVAGVSLGSEALMRAAANIARALGKAQLCFTFLECNSVGLALMGGGELSAAVASEAETVVILENDLRRRPEGAALLETAKHVIVLDYLSNTTTAKAELILPTATFAESDGTMVNNEGRAQRFFQAMLPSEDTQAAWRWLRDMIGASWLNLDEVIDDFIEAMPFFKPIAEVAPRAGFRIDGQKIARESHRASGRTAMHAEISIHEPPTPNDLDSPLAFSMEGTDRQPPAPLIPRYWSPGWNSVQALNKFQSEIGGPLKNSVPGCRLFDAEKYQTTVYFKDIPAAFEPREGDWLVVPLYHIFGSEELSVLSPGITQQAPAPYIAMSPEDAGADVVELTIKGQKYQLPVKRVPGLPRGIAGLPVGLPHSPVISLPAWGKVLSL